MPLDWYQWLCSLSSVEQKPYRYFTNLNIVNFISLICSQFLKCFQYLLSLRYVNLICQEIIIAHKHIYCTGSLTIMYGTPLVELLTEFVNTSQFFDVGLIVTLYSSILGPSKMIFSTYMCVCFLFCCFLFLLSAALFLTVVTILQSIVLSS